MRTVIAIPVDCGHLALVRIATDDKSLTFKVGFCCACFKNKWKYFWENCGDPQHSHLGGPRPPRGMAALHAPKNILW